MLKNMKDLWQGMSSSSRAAHEASGDIWRQAAEEALAHPGFHDRAPELQARLLELLAKSVFLLGSSRITLNFGLNDSPDGMSYIMPTISDDTFSRLRATKTTDTVHDAAAFFTTTKRGTVGAICLRPVELYSPLTRQVIIAHELTHADDQLNNNHSIRINAGLETADHPELRTPYESALRELHAYYVSGIVLDNATNGAFSEFAEEMYSETRAKLLAGVDTIVFPDRGNYPSLREVECLGSSALSSTLDQLHQEGVIDTGSLIATMGSIGLIHPQ